MTYEDFVGPEHWKIQESIDLKSLIPWYKKLELITKLWQPFPSLMAMMKTSLDELQLIGFKTKVQSWVTSIKKHDYLS